MNKPPTENDWRSESWCLDAKAAYRRFNGATLDEAYDLFAENALSRQEYLK